MFRNKMILFVLKAVIQMQSLSEQDLVSIDKSMLNNKTFHSMKWLDVLKFS